MRYQTTNFERDVLYREVWAKPIRTVAKRYDISDVGLRKICVNLGVPVPPKGHWAKLAAGKKVPTVPLPSNHDGPTTHTRRTPIDEHADERQSRVDSLMKMHAGDRLKAPELRPPVQWHAVVTRTSRALGDKPRGGADFLHCHDRDALTVSVSPACKDRALALADALLQAAIASGATLVKGSPQEPNGPKTLPLHLNVMGHPVMLWVDEEVVRTTREMTREEELRLTKFAWERPNLVVIKPTGKLKLRFKDTSYHEAVITVRDGVKRIETRLPEVIPRLWQRVAELRVEQEIREEEWARFEQRQAEADAKAEQRQAELARLKQTEKLARNWRRAKLLRKYANAAEQTGTVLSAGPTGTSLAEELAWIRRAADWLDPLVARHWTAVDKVEEPDDYEW